MDLYKKSLLMIVFSSLAFFSCNTDNTRGYRLAEDGLIYKLRSNELYTGRITDTLEVIIEFEVVNGVKHGEFISHYNNGNIEKIGWIKKNKNMGEWKYFYPSGMLECQGSFFHDIPEGFWQQFYDNGKIKASGRYRNGKQDGEWIFFDINGKVIDNLYYKDGNIIHSFITTI